MTETEQLARVIETDGSSATVEASRSTMCEGCESRDCGGACTVGDLFSHGRTMRTRADNRAGAKAGDLVEVSTPTGTVLSRAFLVFILPLILALGAYYIVLSLSGSGTAALISAAAGLAVSVAVVLIVERTVRRRRPEVAIVRIIREAESSEAEDGEGGDG
ncbi:MAG: SoxR reducing system RseC family protein [Clostridia bacterium]|nr:SoxR reducing system RseC family protein [Clostridia bacterium]